MAQSGASIWTGRSSGPARIWNRNCEIFRIITTTTERILHAADVHRSLPATAALSSLSAFTDGADIVEACIKRPWPPEVDPRAMDDKIAWCGTVTAVQPRIRLTRSFDERSHTYLGYLLRIAGTVGGEATEFRVGIGAGAHAKYAFRIGDQLEGVGHPVIDPRLEIVDLYRVSKLRILRRGENVASEAPWHGVLPPLQVYRERGHRRLAAKTYDSNCQSCLWGCAMPVEIIVDHWNPEKRRYRTETFCYGPLSCPVYKSGPRRNVPGRNGMSYEEPDWLDQDATSHRGLDE